MLDKIINIISNYQGIEKEKITLQSDLIKDLGLSSFDITELVCAFEDEFGLEIPDRKIRTFQTVEDIVKFIESQE